MDGNHFENGSESGGLAGPLAAGEGLPVLDPGGLVLTEGEVLHAQGTVEPWWFGDMPVDEVGGGFFAFGRPMMFAATALGSWLVGRARRRRVERLAAPQWRRMGPTSVFVTSERVMMCTAGAWGWMWLNELIDATPEAEVGRRLWLTTEDEAPFIPFVLEGPFVPYLTVVIHYLLAVEHQGPDGGEVERAAVGVGFCAQHRGP